MKRLLTFAILIFFLLSARLAAAQENHGTTLTWGASSCSAVAPQTCSSFGYNVFEGSAPGKEGSTPINSSLVSGLSFTDDGPTMNSYLGTTRCYVVQAQEVVSGLTLSSANSPEACISFPAPPAAPATPAATIH